jgi:hypothetical protein
MAALTVFVVVDAGAEARAEMSEKLPLIGATPGALPATGAAKELTLFVGVPSAPASCDPVLGICKEVVGSRHVSTLTNGSKEDEYVSTLAKDSCSCSGWWEELVACFAPVICCSVDCIVFFSLSEKDRWTRVFLEAPPSWDTWDTWDLVEVEVAGEFLSGESPVFVIFALAAVVPVFAAPSFLAPSLLAITENPCLEGWRVEIFWKPFIIAEGAVDGADAPNPPPTPKAVSDTSKVRNDVSRVSPCPPLRLVDFSPLKDW